MNYDELVSPENLLRSWWAYRKGKGKKREVIEFERHLEDNLFDLHRGLKEETYVHGRYSYFRITDPKKRDIYKSTVRDRIVHQALYEYLRGIYEPLFIKNSFSSRKGKGVHRAVVTVWRLANRVRKEKGRCWVLKGDIRKYFENIRHETLLKMIEVRVQDGKILALLGIIVRSFQGKMGHGVPLGNITSQVFANIYLNELDAFVTNDFGIQTYIRYNDDFVIMGSERSVLLADATKMRAFLKSKLALELPDEKMILRKFKWGVDFCGCVVLPNATLLRNRTKVRIFARLESVSGKYKHGRASEWECRKVLDSYFGLLSHCKSYNLRKN